MPGAVPVNPHMRSAIAQFEWEATSLGPRESWPQTLSTVVDVVLDSAFPMLVMWGDDLVQLYNDGFIPIYGDKHPASLGGGARISWAEIWNDVGPLLSGAYERGESVFFENLPLTVRRSDEEEPTYFTFSYGPIRDGSSVRGILCIAVETTAQVLREREADERNRALAELDRAKTLFFGNVSHEFRTPLTLMLGPLEDLVRALPEYEWRQAADLARRNAVRLQKLVNSLLDFSLAQSGLSERRPTAVDVGRLTADLASEFRSAFDRAGLYLAVNVPEGLAIATDRAMFEKIVLNLLSNALKFTFEGGVRIDGTLESAEFVLRVSDTGTGIADVDLPHLFERFARIRGARSRTYEGSGIGLALVHELVSIQGGSIGVDSSVRHGTTFTVRLPAVAVPVGAEPSDVRDTHLLRQGFREEAEALVDRQPASPMKSSDAPRVYVVDDNADLRAYLRRLLEPAYAVGAAADWEELCALVDREGAPDLIVLDVMMPVVDGFEAARRLRADPRTAPVPLLFLTARAGNGSLAHGLREGDEYVVKPFVGSDLLARIENLLRRLGERRAHDGERLDMARERREHALLAAAADRFIAAVDTVSVAKAVTSTLVPEFADWCVLYVPSEDGTLRALSVQHRDREKTELGILLERRYPYRVGDGSPSARVFETGAPFVVAAAAPGFFADHGRDEHHAAILASLALRSAAFVPIEIDGAVAAAIGALRAENEAGFDERDVAFLERLAARSALAMRSSRTYERDRTIALTLQRAMLPASLPSVPGLRFSASYAPAAQESLVGGDWYDAFVLPDGRVYLSIGDVVGHGLDAATVMATLRQGLRALAHQAPGPGSLVRQLNRMLCGQELSRLATAVVLEIDPATMRARVANAGHPYPIFVRRDGTVEVLRAGGMMLGIDAEAEFTELGFQMLPGDSLALYTDGYVERDLDAAAGEAFLVEALRRAHCAANPAAQVHLAVLGSEPPRDDAALLITGIVETRREFYERIPATREAASGLRRSLKIFLAGSTLEEERRFEMLVAVGEAVIYSVEHAYGDRPGDLAVKGTIDGDEVLFEVEDFGRWSSRKRTERGYGLPLMHAFARVLSIDRQPTGTRLRLSSRLESPIPART